MRKKIKTAVDAEGVDRLGDLPEHLRQHILSFLELKQAVRTAVLSKQWRYLWTYRRDLDFNWRSFKSITTFRRFVRKVLAFRDNTTLVSRLHLLIRSTSKADESLLCRVANYTASHNVDRLVLESAIAPFTLPNAVFKPRLSKTLELIRFAMPEILGFRSLTILFLVECNFQHVKVEECIDPFANCINLTKLTLIACKFSGIKILKLRGPKLVNLILCSHAQNLPQVEISGPKLTSVYFKCFGAPLKPILLVNLSWLGSACIDIDFSQNEKRRILMNDVEEETQKLCHNFFNMLLGVQNARTITLSTQTFVALILVCARLRLRPSSFTWLSNVMVDCSHNVLLEAGKAFFSCYFVANMLS